MHIAERRRRITALGKDKTPVLVFCALLKRGIHGTYVSVEPFHLFRYLDEQAYRYNNRKEMTDFDRFKLAASQIVGTPVNKNWLVKYIVTLQTAEPGRAGRVRPAGEELEIGFLVMAHCAPRPADVNLRTVLTLSRFPKQPLDLEGGSS
jgi:hypothetical protein